MSDIDQHLAFICITSYGGRTVVDRRPQHVVHPVGVEHERRIGNVVLAGRLGQAQALLEHGPVAEGSD